MFWYSILYKYFHIQSLYIADQFTNFWVKTTTAYYLAITTVKSRLFVQVPAPNLVFKNNIFLVIGSIYLIAQIFFSLLFSIFLLLSCYIPFIATSNQPIPKSLHRISIRLQLHPHIPSPTNTDLIDYLLSLYIPFSHPLQIFDFLDSDEIYTTGS